MKKNNILAFMNTGYMIEGYDRKITSFVTCICVFLLVISCTPTQRTITKVVIVPAEEKVPKNIIFLIGDGMGLTQISALHYKNQQKSSFVRFPVVGLQTCHSADNLVTDSAAGATAMASGVKTKNGMIGMDELGVQHPTIFDIAQERGMSTGMVVTSSVVGATPAAFYAHQNNRGFNEQIAEDFLESDIDFVVGGGLNHFKERTGDNRNLIKELINKSYVVHNFRNTKMKNPGLDSSFNYLYLTADYNPDRRTEGREYLMDATEVALDFLEHHSSQGYFLMIEGSQIDWAGHKEDPSYLISEMKEFDQVIDAVLDYSMANKETLVVVSADHETGGLSLSKGNLKGRVKLDYTQNLHSGTMVPVFAFGPGAELFNGVYDNTDIFTKFKKLVRSE